MQCDYLIVGAGLYGCVIAERIANDLGKKILVIDKRRHIGGNCYSKIDKTTGIEYHQYGTHVFHTSLHKVWKYITSFTEFNNYYHQVLTCHKQKVYQMPINLETINAFYNLNLKPFEVGPFLKKEVAKERIHRPKNFEEKGISLIGRPLYEAFIRGYTIKQWGMDPRELPVEIFSRLPIRHNYHETYFKDAKWQGIPLDGYTTMFKKLLASPRITVKLNCDYFNHRHEFHVRNKTIYTGPIDRYFKYKYGRLQWRSVEFKKKILSLEDYQGTSVMNYADLEVPFIRIHEPKHLHQERNYSKKKTIIFYEKAKEDVVNPYYPIKSDRNIQLLQKYNNLANKINNLVIGGRLGEYAYYDMDKTISAALKCYERHIR